MTTYISHMLRRNKKRRHYPGENQAYLLVRWLNHVYDEPRTRVTTLIETGKELIGLRFLDEFPTATINPYGKGVTGSPAAFANSRRVARLVRTINRTLAKFKMSARYGRTLGSLWRMSWVPVSNRHRLCIRVYAGGNSDEIPFGEGNAVSSVLHLAEQGRLGQLRKCACGNWFYARFRHQKFCATPCQQKDFRRTDEFRASRRAYMRTHRMRLAKQARRTFNPRSAESRETAC
jgi:hypothetical protein